MIVLLVYLASQTLIPKRGEEQKVTYSELIRETEAGNVSEVRYRLARLLKSEDQKRSKRYLLDSLAEAPRYREAQKLLLEFQESSSNPEKKPIPPKTPDLEEKKE